jgi:hypothetical protein
MRKCTDCPHYKVLNPKEEELGCSFPSEELTDIVCLLRRILWQTCGVEYVIKEQTDILETDADDEDDDEADKWKV